MSLVINKNIKKILKTFISSRLPFVVFAFILMSFGDPYTVKRISDKDFRYEFYTTDKKVTPEKNQMYSWFKGGLIHEAQGGIAGDLLNDKFIKMYHNNQLAEQGRFKNGLRVGEWKTWHQNGVLASLQMWHNGLRWGKFLRYDVNSVLVESGSFISNKKNGKWINLENRDILIYKRGIAVIEKESFTKSEKYRINQEKSKLKNDEKVQKELDAAADADKLVRYKAIAKKEKEAKIEVNKAERTAKKEARKKAKEQSKNEPKKDSKIKLFFKNLFKKKDKTAK